MTALPITETDTTELRSFSLGSTFSLRAQPRPAMVAHPLRFQLLGPVIATAAGQELTPKALKVRILLATLLVHRNAVVSVDSLTNELWGDSPPRTALQALRVYVSQLRQSLGASAPALLTTQAPGYRLEVDADMLDLADWDRHCAAARQAQHGGNLELAGQQYRRALALWRGPALIDVLSGALLSGVALGLDDARVATIGRLTDIDLQLGRHLDVIAELRSLTSEHRFDEGLNAQLMIALHRSGRTIDALSVYRRVRHDLVEQLGVEPSRRLQGIHHAVLTADPKALDRSWSWSEKRA